MELTPRLRLMNWLVSQGLTGLPENDLIRGFCERCCAEGLPVSRGMVFIDTLHPIFEGRGFRWNDTQTNESDAFEYGSTNEGEAARGLAELGLLSHARTRRRGDCRSTSPMGRAHRYKFVRDLAEKGHKHVVAYAHRFGEAGTMGQMDCVYSYWVTRRDEGFGAQGLAALRDLVPVLGLAIKSAAQADIARTLGGSISGAMPLSRCCARKIARGVTEQINTVLWFSDLRGSTAISESIDPGEIIPFLNDYAQASIDAIHDAGGEVLKLIGDGVLAMFTHDNLAVAKRAALRAEHRFRRNMKALTVRRVSESRPVTTAHVGLHVGEVFYGNIGSDDRLDFTVVGPAVNEVSRIASMCRSVDRELLMSSAFRAGLDATGRNYLVSTGRYALRGIGRAQDLYTLDPDIAADEVVAGKYERYLAS